MMTNGKYNYLDVIIDPHDERVVIGEKYYFGTVPTLLLHMVNLCKKGSLTLDEIDETSIVPFRSLKAEHGYCCIIKAKE